MRRFRHWPRLDRKARASSGIRLASSLARISFRIFYRRKCETRYTRLGYDGLVHGGVEIFTVEMSMHGSFDKFQEHRNRTNRDWNIALFALPILVVTALVAMAIIQPNAPSWISEAAQAEFAGMNSPDVVPARSAQPAMQVRTVKAD